uniref:Chromosome 17 C4orf33 homolog n=1 Tax=Bos taurus TaxID=9913 RepID=A0AAA9TF59_BOVIN
MDFKIEHTWDGFPVKHEPVFVRLNPGDRGVMMEVSAPFFNDPPAPLGEPGKPFNQLWDYEVVEAFFLNDVTEQYLEVELCPHGQHLVLLLSGRRNVWKQGLDLSFRVSRGETKWEGSASIPWSYFPPNVTKFNSFAIHGSKDERSYEALYPVPQHELQQGQKPDLFLYPWDSPGKNTGVGCCALLQGIFLIQGSNPISYISCIGRWILYHQRHLGSPSLIAKSLQSCPTLCNPVDSSPPGSAVPRILQARTLDHRLDYFKPFSFNTLLGEKWNQPESDLWLIEKPDV